MDRLLQLLQLSENAGWLSPSRSSRKPSSSAGISPTSDIGFRSDTVETETRRSVRGGSAGRTLGAAVLSSGSREAFSQREAGAFSSGSSEADFHREAAAVRFSGADEDAAGFAAGAGGEWDAVPGRG